MKAFLLALLLFPGGAYTQTIDLSGTWRSSTRDLASNAFPATDDSQWQAFTLPLHNTRPPEGLWLRRTIVAPDGATTLVLGRLPLYRLFINGIEQSVSGAPGPLSYRIADGSSSLTIAIRIGAKRIPGPNQLLVDEGPYLLSGGPAAKDAIQRARDYLQHQFSAPYALLAGCQLTLVIALLLIWFITGRQYSTLFWVAGYILYSSHNLLRFSLLPQLPPSPRFIPAVLSLQFALAVSGRDSRRNTLALWGIYVGALIFGGNAVSGESSSIATGYINAGTTLTAVAIMAFTAWRAEGRMRLIAIAGCLYWILVPIGVVFREPLLIETPVGYWPVLGLLNVPLTISVVLWLTAQFAGERRELIRLHAEFEAARMVQQVLLPEAQLTSGNLSVDAVYEPAQEVGGDFYYVAEDAGRIIVVVGDVTGKGLRAAMIVSLLIGTLRETRETSPAAILHRLNMSLLRKGNAGFVTCCCIRFDPDGTATAASAGHPSPYADGCEWACEAALPLGVTPEVEYPESMTSCSQVVLVSDGVMEAANPGGDLFGFDRTRDVSMRAAQEIADTARAWGQNDDITVVTVRRLQS